MKCQLCKEEVALPYKCSYCGQFFCDDHRLPEQHLCPGLPKKGTWARHRKIKQVKTPQQVKPKIQDKIKTIKPETNVTKSAIGPYDHDENYTYTKHIQKKKRKRIINSIFKVSLLIVIIGLATSYYYDLYDVKEFIDIKMRDFSNVITNFTNTNRTPSLTDDDKDTKNESTYEKLVEYALLQINIERHDRGLQNVSLGNNSCAQNHAENMLEHRYLSHWDTNGLKPYMRYTLGGGKALVAENIGWMSSTGHVEAYPAIHDLNWNMIYDDADSNWGHRDNILDPNHNKVNIGIAWGYSNLYLVQDFEDDYFTKSVVSKHQNVISMEFQANIPTWNLSQIAIYFDRSPHNLTVSELSRSPYDSSYSQGSLIGGVLPMGYYFEGMMTINTGDWVISYDGSQTSFSSSFDLTDAFNKYGTGVYTLIIWGEERPYTTISIWNK